MSSSGSVGLPDFTPSAVSPLGMLGYGVQVAKSATVTGAGAVTFYTVPPERVAYLIYAHVISRTVTGGIGGELRVIIGGSIYTILQAVKDSTIAVAGAMIRLSAGDSLACVADSGQVTYCSAILVELGA